MSSAPALPAIVLTDGGAGDLDAVMRIMGSAFDPAYGEGWSKSQCAGILPLGGVALTMACDRNGAAHGFALVRSVAGEAELLLLAVAAESQGRGYGGALLDGFLRDGRAAGHRLLHLEVRDGNGAVALYERYGFRPIGRRAAYYRGPGGVRHDAVTMAIDLTANANQG